MLSPPSPPLTCTPMTHISANGCLSAVILGVPLLKALLGPKYSNLGVVAGISSFIFQLPLMLILFEVSGSLARRCWAEAE